jgi:hypothetical protein
MLKLRRGFNLRVISLLVISLAVPVAQAGDFWSKKSYEKWSADETRDMLAESPWATTVTLGGLQSNASAPPGAPSYRGEMEENPQIVYTLQFRSALPIREAQVRSSQIGSHYDKMSAEQKASFDANSAKFLATAFHDQVVISVTFHSNIANYESLLRNYWASQNLAKLIQSAFLNTKAEKLTLVSYGFKDDTFQLVFPRPKQLEPEGRISVEFIHPRINVIGQERVFREFNLKKMAVNGELAF